MFLLLPIVASSSKHIRLNKHLVGADALVLLRLADLFRTIEYSCPIFTKKATASPILRSWLMPILLKTMDPIIHILDRKV